MKLLFHPMIVLMCIFFGNEQLTAQHHHHDHPHHNDNQNPETLLQTGDIAESGRVEVRPGTGIAGNFGSWTITYTAGAAGLQEGGGIKIQFPDEWHFGERNSAIPLQSSRPEDDFYVSAKSSRENVSLETIVEGESEQTHLIKAYRQGVDHRGGRYIYVVHVRVADGQLREGDTISVIYGDTSAGGRGMRAPKIVTSPSPIKIAVDSNGNDVFELHPDPPKIENKSENLAKIRLTGPSSPVLNQSSKLHLAFLDRFNNPVDSFRGEVSFTVLQGKAEMIESVNLDLDKGWTTIEFVPADQGILRVKASVIDDLYTIISNPMKIVESENDLKVYWGDLHSHSEYSHDAVGTESFNYARNVARLDFYALTDHTSQPDNDGYIRSLWHDVYDEYTALTDQHNEPGRFATIHAMEVSFGTPWGHHNLFYRDEPKDLYSPDMEGFSLPKLWDLLVAGEALTIPHHTAKMVRNISWEPHNPEFRRNFEIYSGHGLSEEFDPGHPLAAGASKFTSPTTPHMLPQYAQDAWKSELKLSTIAASDDHISQPGKPQYGLAAVQAAGLTRQEIFDALYERRTYGTTGERILVNFQVNGAQMGQTIQSESHPLLEIEVHGTDDIEWVEVLRYTNLAGDFEVIHKFYPDTPDIQWSKVDYGFADDSIYYIRLKQTGMVEDRIIMAWSSPVWVEKINGG